jgi:predicted transcriptional regulator
MNRRSLYMLLEHGPLSINEVLEITGWKSYRKLQQLLTEMANDGFLRRTRRGVFALKNTTV